MIMMGNPFVKYGLIFTHPEWCWAGMATFMLYHLIQVSLSSSQAMYIRGLCWLHFHPSRVLMGQNGNIQQSEQGHSVIITKTCPCNIHVQLVLSIMANLRSY